MIFLLFFCIFLSTVFTSSNATDSAGLLNQKCKLKQPTTVYKCDNVTNQEVEYIVKNIGVLLTNGDVNKPFMTAEVECLSLVSVSLPNVFTASNATESPLWVNQKCELHKYIAAYLCKNAIYDEVIYIVENSTDRFVNHDYSSELSFVHSPLGHLDVMIPNVFTASNATKLANEKCKVKSEVYLCDNVTNYELEYIVKNINELLANHDNVTELFFSDSHLGNVDVIIPPGHNFEAFGFSYCSVEWLNPDLLMNQPNVTRLGLLNNAFTRIPKLNHAGQIEALNLLNNPISSIEAGDLAVYKRLYNFVISISNFTLIADDGTT